MITGDHLAEVLIEMTDTLVDDVTPVEFLQLVTTRAAAMSQSAWAGVLLADPEGRLQLTAASSESAALRELIVLEKAEGPWLDCVRTGSPVVNTDLRQAADGGPSSRPGPSAPGSVRSAPFPCGGAQT